MDSVKSSNSMPVIAPNIRKPTMISAGAVAKAGMARNKGDKKRETMKKKATNMAVNPVLPPSLTPVALSTKVVTRTRTEDGTGSSCNGISHKSAFNMREFTFFI